jgi:hypothetical protein
MGIANYLEDISEDFDVYGFTENGTWESFIIGQDYEAFLISKK